MKTKPTKPNKNKRKSIRKTLAMTISPALLSRIPWSDTNFIAFVALALFGLWPVMVLIPTMWHCSFDRMVDWNMHLLDKFMFPMVVALCVTAYAITLVKPPQDKRPLSKKMSDNSALLIFLGLVVWMAIDIPFTNGVTNAVKYGMGLKHESFPLVLEYFLCFLPLGLFLRNQTLKRWLLRGMTVVSAVLASCAFYLHDNLTCSPYYYDWTPSFSTIFTTWNYYGYFLTIFIGLSAALFTLDESRGWRYFYAYSISINTIVLSCNNSLGAWIGSFCACLFIVAARRVMDGKFHIRSLQALALFTLVLCLTGLVNGRLGENVFGLSSDMQNILTDPSSGRAASAGSGRWRFWTESMKFIAQNPLFGIGYEGVHVRVLEVIGNPRPHNEYIQYTLFYGIPGGLLYIAACAGVYVRAFRRRARLDGLTLAALTAAFGYLMGSFFGLTVYNTAPYLFIMLGLGYVWTDDENAERGGKKRGRKGVAFSDGA